jgi:isopentenyl diphosphate isomerase/L-lactate dehydrogenase-like FMN-dependent dehydrogenase
VASEPAGGRTTRAIIDEARAALSELTWDYVVGGAETETTMRRNRAALDALALRPRVLRDVSSVDASTTLLGHPLRIPVLLAPIGALETITPEGAAASARAAERFGVLAMVSSVTEPRLEQVAALSGAPLLCQLYVRGDDAWVDELVDRAVDAGYAAIALTVDAAHYGRRERQLKHGWAPPEHATSDLSWQARLTWRSVERIRDRAGLPLIIKGIQAAEDAELAVEHGVAVVYVSNHGGRDLDHGPATLDALREIVDAVAGRAEIVVDGGFLRGGDVCKAIALGANAVGLGRLHALALAAGGAATLIEALELLELEIRTTMGLIGVSRLDELDASFVVRSIALPSASPLQSAFPPVPQTDWPPSG